MRGRSDDCPTHWRYDLKLDTKAWVENPVILANENEELYPYDLGRYLYRRGNAKSQRFQVTGEEVSEEGV